MFHTKTVTEQLFTNGKTRKQEKNENKDLTLLAIVELLDLR